MIKDRFTQTWQFCLEGLMYSSLLCPIREIICSLRVKWPRGRRTSMEGCDRNKRSRNSCHKSNNSWDPNAQFNSATSLCLSVVRTWISSVICRGILFIISELSCQRGDCLFCWYWWNSWLSDCLIFILKYQLKFTQNAVVKIYESCIIRTQIMSIVNKIKRRHCHNFHLQFSKSSICI